METQIYKKGTYTIVQDGEWLYIKHNVLNNPSPCPAHTIIS